MILLIKPINIYEMPVYYYEVTSNKYLEMKKGKWIIKICLDHNT